jgi:hypothetical protein
MKNSYIINKTYEINELQYYILYVHVHYHFVILDSGPWTCIEKSFSINHSWLRCEDTSSRHMTQPISSHIVLGRPHVLENEGTLVVSWDMSGTFPSKPDNNNLLPTQCSIDLFIRILLFMILDNNKTSHQNTITGRGESDANAQSMSMMLCSASAIRSCYVYWSHWWRQHWYSSRAWW